MQKAFKILTLTSQSDITPIPTQWIGPLLIHDTSSSFEVSIPLATYETPLWASTNRGAKAAKAAGGINVQLLKESMTRSILLEAQNVRIASENLTCLKERFSELNKVVASTGQYVTLKGMHAEIVGKLLFLRFDFSTGDASGHNMATKAAEALLQWICREYPSLAYVSISGNICTDKKVSAINGILGRGKHGIADIILPSFVCRTILKSSAQAIHDLNTKKNLIGSILAGSLRSANAHFANSLLAIYLATGQDAANIVEGSQGIVTTDVIEDSLYFSVSLPNIIVGTRGNGKHHPYIQENLKKMGCLNPSSQGDDARRLAKIVAATVLCSELSLLAAQTNPGELMRAHEAIERSK